MAANNHTIQTYYYPTHPYIKLPSSSYGPPTTTGSGDSFSADQTPSQTAHKTSYVQLKTQPLEVQVEWIIGENTKLKTKVDELERKNIVLEQKVDQLAASLKSFQSHPTTPRFQNETPDYEPIPMTYSPYHNTPSNTPPPTTPRSDIAASHKKVETAIHFLGDDDFVCALRYINEAITFNPKNASAFAYKSEICRMMNDFSSSLKAAEDAIAIDADIIMALVNKTLALRFLGRTQEALDSSKIVLSKEPNNIFALETKLETLFMLGNHKESLLTIGHTSIHHPNNPTANRVVALIQQTLSNRSELGGTEEQFPTEASSMGDT